MTTTLKSRIDQLRALVASGHLLDTSTYRYADQQSIGAYVAQKVTHRQQIIDALLDDKTDKGAFDLGARIHLCDKRYTCSSPFCPRCRHTKQDAAVQAVNDAFGNVPENELFFLTVLLPIEYDPNNITTDTIAAVKTQLRNHLRNRATVNPAYDDIRWFGSFEIDVKWPVDAASERAKQTLVGLGLDMSRSDPAFLPHLHALVRLPPSVSRDEFRDGLVANLFPKAYQVRFTSLRKDKEKADNLRSLATYMLKFRVQRSDNIDTGYSDESDKQYRRTMYSSLYDPPMLRTVIKLIDRIGNSQSLMFKSVQP